MKVVLLENIENIGKQYEIKEVADGYARNFLIPKGLVKIATDEVLQWAGDMQSLVAQKAAKELETVGDTASKMEGLEVEIKVKVGDQDQLFEKINPQKVAAKLKEMGYNIKKSQIELAEDIEEVGEFDAKIKFAHNLEVEIKVIVFPEATESKEEDS